MIALRMEKLWRTVRSRRSRPCKFRNEIKKPRERDFKKSQEKEIKGPRSARRRGFVSKKVHRGTCLLRGTFKRNSIDEVCDSLFLYLGARIEANRKQWMKGGTRKPMTFKFRNLLIQEHIYIKAWLESGSTTFFELPKMRADLRTLFSQLFKDYYQLTENLKGTKSEKLRAIRLVRVCRRSNFV